MIFAIAIKAVTDMDAPCKDCPDRVLGCHSVCEKYKQFQEERTRELERKRMQYLTNHLGNDYFRRYLKFKQRLKRNGNYK